MVRLKKRYLIPSFLLLIVLLFSSFGWWYWQSLKQELDLTVDWRGMSIGFNGLCFDELTLSKQSQLKITGKNLKFSWSNLSATDLEIYWQANQSKIDTDSLPIDDKSHTEQSDSPFSNFASFYTWLPKLIHIDSIRFYQQHNELIDIKINVEKQLDSLQLRASFNKNYSGELSANLLLNRAESRVDITTAEFNTVLTQANIKNAKITVLFNGWLKHDRLSLNVSNSTINAEQVSISPNLMLANLNGTLNFAMQSKIPVTIENVIIDGRFNIQNLDGIYDNVEIKSASSGGQLLVKDNKFLIETFNTRIRNVNVGILFENVKFAGEYLASFNAISKGKLSWHRFESTLFSGKILVNNSTINFNKLKQSIKVYLKAIQLKDILTTYPVEGLNGEGSIDGMLPIKITQIPTANNNRYNVSIENGELATTASGYLAFNNSALQDYAKNNPNMQLVTNVLQNFEYTKLAASVNYADEIANLAINIQGKNPKIKKGKAVNLNINLQENIVKLLMSLQLSDHISEPIRQRIEAHLKKESFK
ncbi:YdbH domain-containing protein [Gilliamella sp. B3464]|uniref:intermembrane phospholipid transport protein YdbH family protein n=1 Tax=unclassified Gilliamella TaxID=2685620 RepID=UPI00226A60CC|nr:MULTISPECIES: YdbH domain-containing protein [unclassified Gilliamella]MCX8713072.1 YdbH domain-containing protein [Gilliamella sp. B3468]MCX8752200.1 YdbH domain-containing protein [Gilliamella sp. B3464]